ncbi:MAG: thiosulfate oxidation carrier complex protein SoxZ [Burkholderiales bacterium]|nr:thiosulfate oxidation carrier complex protein SoxZ [Burkholderiales bacterium]
MSVVVTAHLKQDITQIRVAIEHISEDGQRIDHKTGKFVPVSFVKQLTIKADDRVLADANLGGALAHNPTLTFKARNLKAGMRVVVEWSDTDDKSGKAETVVSA